jgi:hypothetical protein
MRNAGVQMIAWEGDVGGMSRMAAAMRQQGFSVPLPNWGGALYDDNAVKIAGSDAIEGSVIDNVYGMFKGEDGGRIPEIATFDQWMARTDPSQVVDLFAFYGWLSGRLFELAADKAGAVVTRQKMLTALSQIGTWDDQGGIAPINAGQKKPSDCFMLFTIHNGKYLRTFPTDKNYSCDFGGFVFK